MTHPQYLHDFDPRLPEWLDLHGWSVSSQQSTEEETPEQQVERLEILDGDISARSYVRLHLRSRTGRSKDPDGDTVVLAIYPKKLAATYRRFVAVTSLLQDVGVRVPEILNTDKKRRFMLVEDLGPLVLHKALSKPTLRAHTAAEDVKLWRVRMPWFRTALEIARRIGSIPVSKAVELGSPPLDLDLLERELRQTWRAYFKPAKVHVDPGLERDLKAFLDQLCQQLAALPPKTCHRDFMVRNLVHLIPLDTDAYQLEMNDVAVIDYQDLRPGPPVYDVASLLNDTLIPPPNIESELLELAGIAAGSAEEHAYRQAAVQRTLKAIGSYAASGHHMKKIPRTLRRTLYHLRQLPEAQPLLPALEQSWTRIR